MSEYGNSLSWKTGEKRFNPEEERKMEKFIEEVSPLAATILAEKHLSKDVKFSVNYVKQKNKLEEEFSKLLNKDNRELAVILFGNPLAEAAKKLADIGEKFWMK